MATQAPPLLAMALDIYRALPRRQFDIVRVYANRYHWHQVEAGPLSEPYWTIKRVWMLTPV